MSHCGRPDCPVCVSFGFSRGDEGSFQGLVQFFDMRILLFPVYTTVGTIWVTGKTALGEVGVSATEPIDGTFRTDKEEWDEIYISGEKYEQLSDERPDLSALNKIPEPIHQRCVILSDTDFYRVVNDNLEVRTSVSIDPETGAAEGGALFTYEAIPRSTIMHFDVVYNKPGLFMIGNDSIKLDQEQIKRHIKTGMDLLETLGIGGMNTRGMGRIRIFKSNTEATGG